MSHSNNNINKPIKFICKNKPTAVQNEGGYLSV